MKKLWMLLGALTFATQAHSLDPSEFVIENASFKPLYIKIGSDAPRAIPVGEKESFKRTLSSEKDKINFTFYFGEDASESTTVPINSKTTVPVIITEDFRQHLLKSRRSRF